MAKPLHLKCGDSVGSTPTLGTQSFLFLVFTGEGFAG